MRIETLESRRLMSATVSEGYPGFYEIDGTSGADTIEVSVSQENETFTLDGITYEYVVDISIAAYEGDDTITVSSTPDGWIGVSVVAGDGDDEVSVNFAGAIWAGAGEDIVHLSDSFRGEVYGDQDDDEIYVSGDCVDPEIVGGSGADLIDATGNNYGVVIRGGTGDDTIHGSPYDDQIYGDAGADTMYGYGGSDTFYTRDASADSIFGGAGVDFLYADSSDVNEDGVEYTYIA